MDRFFSKAYRYVRERSYDELRWARQQSASKFRRFHASDFLAEYAWVVYVAGFRVATIEKKFPALTQAFKNFDIEGFVGCALSSQSFGFSATGHAPGPSSEAHR